MYIYFRIACLYEGKEYIKETIDKLLQLALTEINLFSNARNTIQQTIVTEKDHKFAEIRDVSFSPFVSLLLIFNFFFYSTSIVSDCSPFFIFILLFLHIVLLFQLKKKGNSKKEFNN